MQAPNLLIAGYNILANTDTSSTTVTTSTTTAVPNPEATVMQLVKSHWFQASTYVQLGDVLIDTAIYVCIALIIALILDSIVRTACKIARNRSVGLPTRLKKIDTVKSILHSINRYTIGCIALFKILLLWGVSAQSLTVSGAIVAGAVGFGSQGLVQDMITGFSLLFENQLHIGDYVQIGDKTGTVTEVGLRIVKLQSPDGSEHIIFNRNITVVSNLKSPTTPAT